MRLPIGTKVKFNQTIIDHANGDHPDMVLARKGDIGTVSGHNDIWPYDIHISNGDTIGCDIGEFDVIEEPKGVGN